MITMFASTKLQFIVLVFLVGSLLSTTIEAELAGYPVIGSIDEPSLIPLPFKPEWAAFIKKHKIPKVAVIPELGVCNTSTPNSCNWSCEHCNRPSDVVYCPTQNDWGLTYDDGPSEFTPALVDYLDSKGLKATFFVIGSRVVQNPEILKKIVNSGHQIGIHTYSHKALTTLTNQQIVAELKWTEQAIKEAGGITPKYVRPPFGDMDDRVRSIFDQLGYTPVIWDKDSSDWKSNTDPTFDLSWVPGNFSQWVLENDPTGHITLEHDFWQQTAAQGPPVIDIVSGAGYNIKTVAECQGKQPYLEQTPTTTPIVPYDSSNSTTNSSSNSTNSSLNSTNSSSNSTSSSSTDSGSENVSIQNVESPTPMPQSSSAPSKYPIKISLIMGFVIGAVVELVF